MEEDVLNALQTRVAYIPGGIDRDGKLIFIVNIINDLQLWNRRCLELSIEYLKSSLSTSIVQSGVTVIVDAQKSSSRITRTHARTLYAIFGNDISVDLFLVRAEGFWEKHVEPCAKSQTKGEPIVLSKARLPKYFDMQHLPEELGGTLHFNYDLWLQQRKSIDEFNKNYAQTLCSMENLHVLLVSNKSLRPTEADVELKKCAQLHASVQQSIESAIEMGNLILARLNEVYAQPQTTATTPTMPDTTTTTTTTTTSTAISISLPFQQHNTDDGQQQQQQQPVGMTTPAATQPKTSSVQTLAVNGAANTPTTTCSTVATSNVAVVVAAASSKLAMPPDLCCARSRIELQLNEIEKKQTEIRTAWLELLQSIREARELCTLEEGVAFVTNWILNTAEQLLSRQLSIGSDVRACESLRSAHDALELECRETYGFYAELLYKIEVYAGARDNYAYKDLLSQRDFMHFVCRSFATRLERRRNILITSLRFFRLVGEYFERTTHVFESLVMPSGGGAGVNGVAVDFDEAACNLQQLKESQVNLANIERELVREGEKLSDMLAMPVKDALGRDLQHIDYSDDIGNIRDILDTTMARRKIFSDSVELQKLTLEQVTHIHTYEQDARMALKWLNDLFAVMIRCHSHVGCNIHEIQVQKDELQTFQETGKSIYQYGCQLLEASQALRISCQLDVSAAQHMGQDLQRTWHSLQAISQEHMTRLRVSAVFHRSVEEYCQQLHDLKLTLKRDFIAMERQQQRQRERHRQSLHNGSSGISSDATPSDMSPMTPTPTTTATAEAAATATASAATVEDMCLEDMDSLPSVVLTTPTGHDSLLQALSLSTERREQLRCHLTTREQLLLEVGRMLRLGRLLKTRLKEPFVLDATTGKRLVSIIFRFYTLADS